MSGMSGGRPNRHPARPMTPNIRTMKTSVIPRRIFPPYLIESHAMPPSRSPSRPASEGRPLFLEQFKDGNDEQDDQENANRGPDCHCGHHPWHHSAVHHNRLRFFRLTVPPIMVLAYLYRTLLDPNRLWPNLRAFRSETGTDPIALLPVPQGPVRHCARPAWPG